MTTEREKKICMLHVRFLGNCKCKICRRVMQNFVGKVDLFAMGKAAPNVLVSCPGKIPPLAPYGGKSGTRIGSFKTVVFRLVWDDQLDYPLIEQSEEVAA